LTDDKKDELYERVAAPFAELTDERRAAIDCMSHYALCAKWRNAPIGDTFWQGPAGQYATDRLFKHFGGFNPAISKRIGWDG
jgi:hypothetical protein